jgi:rhodanese-related sulfurtransferase
MIGARSRDDAAWETDRVPEFIGRDEVRRLLGEEDAQLVEVLPEEEFEEEHLPGAINIPLRRIDAEAPRLLDRDRPVVTYCWDDP